MEKGEVIKKTVVSQHTNLGKKADVRDVIDKILIQAFLAGNFLSGKIPI